MANSAHLDQILRHATEAGEIPGAVAVAASGGELIETIALIEMPAHRMICAAEIGATKASSCTVRPNQVHNKPLTAR